ncbi:hypothetical protein H2201_003207 [Coniosporium apollinis]|uniref:CST complex subunit Stn1 N-terminal domain-containing protein n=1 Tax=Coniosporium apollinis TaxID=61459 RepID=A0ABQ9NYZ3_9PEZI|nr:hypothetical protein H2201_003207 [Coniosporium apollinis]
MTSRPPASSASIAAPCYWSASPTYHTWVKLTAADIHTLRAERGYEGQGVYFHLNHPIRYVRLVAPILAIDDLSPRLTFLTLDDGSGATIEVKVQRLDPAVSSSVDCPSNTVIENVNIDARLGVFDVVVDGRRLDVGTVVKVKCGISEFRKTRQLELKRISVVDTTDEEARAWEELALFRRQVLDKPWVLSAEEMKAAEEQVRREKRKEREREKRKREHDELTREKRERRAEKNVKLDEKAERRRREEEVMFNAGALI